MKLIRYLALGLLVIATISGVNAQNTIRSGNPQNFSDCINGYYGCDPRQLSESERAAVADATHRRNYSDCLHGFYSCDLRQLTKSERAAVADAAYGRNYSDCLNGFYSCDLRQLTETERAAVADAAHRRNYSDCLNGFYSCNLRQLTEAERAAVGSRKPETPRPGVVAPAGQNTSSTATAPCAENGSCYGDLNANGVPKTVHVNGYYRKDGTYVRGYYRSAPGSNPPKASK
ncbi:MAG: hypothetical protein WB780_12800 [Candidatus Acidiferrales bacterium]